MSGAGHGVPLSILIVLALGAADAAAENTLSKILGGWPLMYSETPVNLLGWKDRGRGLFLWSVLVRSCLGRLGLSRSSLGEAPIFLAGVS